ncbi:hypothetical protein Tco_0452897 [Tanacetum coccineum]
MHNNIMAAGSKDRPPMLGPGRYSQWRSRFLRYIDTKPNGGGLKKSILSGPYEPTTVQVQAVEAAEGRPAVPQHTSVKTILNMTPENKEHFQSEKEAIFLLLTQFQLEVNDIRAERIAKSENPLALIAAAQRYSDNYYQAPKPQRSKATSSSTRPSASTRHKGKEIAKPITPQSESVSVSDEDNTTPRYNNDNQSRQFGNQRTMRVARARETVGSQLSKLKDTNEEIDEQELEAHYSYMAKIQEVSPEESSSTGQPLEQVQNHDESNVYDNERRHSEQPKSINDTYVLEKDDSNVTPDSSNICTNDNQVDQNASRNVVDELDCAC